MVCTPAVLTSQRQTVLWRSHTPNMGNALLFRCRHCLVACRAAAPSATTAVHSALPACTATGLLGKLFGVPVVSVRLVSDRGDCRCPTSSVCRAWSTCNGPAFREGTSTRDRQCSFREEDKVFMAPECKCLMHAVRSYLGAVYSSCDLVFTSMDVCVSAVVWWVLILVGVLLVIFVVLSKVVCPQRTVRTSRQPVMQYVSLTIDCACCYRIGESN